MFPPLSGLFDPHDQDSFSKETMVYLPVLAVLAVLVVVLAIPLARLWFSTISVSRVEVKEGELLVELPYRPTVQLPEGVTVEWSRCAPDPMKVHVHHNERNRRVSQDEVYRGRTSMKPDCLSTRDLGLTLRDPCYRDSGTFLCSVYKEQQVLAQRAVRLQVKVMEEVVEVGDGAETFTLPFVTTARLPEDATVEWRRSKPVDMVVHVFEDGRNQLYRQDERYYGNTTMNSNPLASKDLSVTINNRGYRDQGKYVCVVRKEGDVLARKEVQLLVPLSWADVEVEPTAKSVRLPWVIAARLPKGACVVWSYTDPTTDSRRKIHVFQDGDDRPEQQDLTYQGRTAMRRNPLQTGDLSLTLINPTAKDSRYYYGSVRENGEVTWVRTVGLKVKE